MRPTISENFTKKSKEIIYLAAPYTHSDEAVKLSRYERVTKAAAHLIENEYIVFSPLTMTHPIDIILAGESATLGSDYWVTFDEAFMEHCCGMVVLKLPGWEESNGVGREMDFFRAKGLPIVLISPEELNV